MGDQAINRRRVVVGVATVDGLDPVLPTAVRLAASMGARLHLVHVVESQPEAPGVPRNAQRSFEDHAGQVRDTLLAHCTRLGCGEVVITVRSGSAHEEVVRVANEAPAQLLIIGATGSGGLWRTILGTTAERILAQAELPVLVLHHPFFGEVEKVVVATDLSVPSEDLYECGLDVVEGIFGAAGIQGRVLFVNSGLLHDAGCPLQVDADRYSTELLRDFLRARKKRSYSVEGRVRAGRPSVEINVEADSWEADLIVMGTHGRVGVARHAFGSVAASTIRDSTRNVLVIPTGAARRRADPPLTLSPSSQG